GPGQGPSQLAVQRPGAHGPVAEDLDDGTDPLGSVQSGRSGPVWHGPLLSQSASMIKTLSDAVLLSAAVERVTSSAIRDLLKITERPDVISLAGGLPAPEAFPAGLIAEALAAAVLDDPASCLQYSTT